MFRDYAWQHRRRFLAGVVFLALTNLITVTIPTQIGAAIDAISAGESAGWLALSVALMGAAVIVVRTLSRVYFFNPGRDMEYALRQDLFSRLLAQQPSFYATRRTGDIVSRASNDISWTRSLVGFGALQGANFVLAVPLTFWKMAGISAWLTFLAMLPIFVGLVVVQLTIRSFFPLMKRNQEELGEISNHILESFQGIATIQGFVAEAAFTERFQERNQQWFRTAMKLAIVRTFSFPMLMFAGGLSVFVLLYVGGPMALEGKMTVGDLVAFATLLAALLPQFRSMGFLFSVWQRGRAGLERIFELMDAPIERPEGDTPAPQSSGKRPGIELRDLSFSYPDAPDVEVLHNISATLPSGETVGIFGRTGSGKTTLLRLLSRLYNPPEGSVLIDGTDIRTLELDTWRKRLAVVPQRPFLFSDSIAANVSLSDAPNLEAVGRAASLASLDQDLASLPDGLQTVVGQRGIMLSGGQRQRVALARGLFRDADLVLLDDVLSAVDHDNEARLVATLAGLSGTGRTPTTLIVSNRISAFRYASVILVLDEGQLVATGDHATLTQQPGIYRDSWLVQREEQEEEVAG
ncbi:MAG: ATP-binding cassette subfamily B multidrug efflux pump [Myxococcota bacterium]|jgi:ATP-binding cassette subfamily B multidrug efflux pump